MLPQQILLLLVLADVFLLALIGIYAFYSYYSKLSQIHKEQEEAHKKAETILAQAQERAMTIMERVEQKSEEILTHSELFKADLDASFKSALKHAIEKYLELLDRYSKQFVVDYEKLLTSVKDNSLKQANQGIFNIEQEINKELNESRIALQAVMASSLDKTRGQIEAYKQEQMRKVESSAETLVVSLAKELLRINLTSKDHDKLVIQALEKAKEQGMFFL